MTRTLPVLVIALAGCPDNPSGNPKVLWLAPDMAETAVKLSAKKPDPY
ncbi:MAG TPA: hypothetical protein VLX92_35160 [Kofleriaceae bacterium]|nr:hypothetical protein [Kofleriaceae bacterium]